MRPDIIAVASSTGGPSALRKICAGLSDQIKIPIVIVQHMPKGFTHSFAESLNVISKLKVKEAEDGDRLEGGTIYIAPGGVHMKVIEGIRSRKIRFSDGPSVNGVKPAADILFESLAEVYRGKTILSIVVTGMGKDGAIGVSKMKSLSNCYCITESKKTAVIYGMPRAVYEAGDSDEEVNLEDIATRVNKIILEW